MSDSASRKSDLQDPSSAAQPGIGDLSALQSEFEDSKSNPHSLGDLKDVEAMASSDVLGDITLLEEAFAEMEDETIGSDDDIPLLHSTIEQPSVIIKNQNLSNSIPVLNQQATEFVKSAMPAANSEENMNDIMDEVMEIEDSISEALPLTSVFTPASELTNPPSVNIDEVSEPVITTFDATDEENPELQASSPTSENASPTENIWSDSAANILSDDNSNKTSFSTMSPDFDNISENPSTLSDISESNAKDEVFMPETKQSTIEDKIAKATGESPSTGFNDIPLSSNQISGLADTELASGFAEDLGDSTYSPPTSEYIPQTKESADMSKSMSIPFELHAQLSKKIDALVLDATMSLTSELESQLSAQLESLLGNAVESVLPKLIDQMAVELRNEVKGRVKHQLPIIVNDVLGKTRLS